MRVMLRETNGTEEQGAVLRPTIDGVLVCFYTHISCYSPFRMRFRPTDQRENPLITILAK